MNNETRWSSSEIAILKPRVIPFTEWFNDCVVMGAYYGLMPQDFITMMEERLDELSQDLSRTIDNQMNYLNNKYKL